MSQLPDAFQGHDLTGWTEGDGEIFRPTVTGVVVSIDSDCEGVHIWGLDVHEESEDAAEAVRIATELATKYGGWALPPIGYSADPGWRYDVEAVPDYQTVQVSYHFGEGDPTPPMVYRKAQRNKAGVWKFYDGHGWELLHGIVYAWREEPGVDPAPPEATP